MDPSKYEVKVKTFSLQDVKENDKILYNVNNIYTDGKQPEDYWSRRYYTGDWIDFFLKDKYHTIVISGSDLEWMKKAKNISQIRPGFPRIFMDELESLCKKHQERFEKIMESGETWFIRTENYSFKYSQHGVGPYNDLKKIFESLISYSTGHACISDDDKSKTIYFIPWIDMDFNREFRIFVYNNQITAISAQHIYVINKWLQGKSKIEIEALVDKIVKYFNENIRDKLTFIGSYVMDLAMVTLVTLIGGEAVGDRDEIDEVKEVDEIDEVNEIPYFIEPNSFGAEYGSGSALFHWIIDHDDLHGLNNSSDSKSIQFRYVDRE